MANLSGIFDKNLDAYQSGAHLIINQGGQGSSKTYSILQLLYLIAKKEKRRITIASYALPHLKQGAMADFDKIVESFGDNPARIKNISESTYYIGKSAVEFFGIEGNVAKAHGPRRDILFINECNRKITYEVYDQLSTRTQGAVFLDFNPDQEFWLHEKVIPNFPHVLIKSTYVDNPWLPEKERNNILTKKDKLGFENWWKVYGLGELGKLEGAIFMNWRYGEFDNSLSYGFGMDFGFNDPDALVKTAIDHKMKKMYWDEKIYKEGNSFEDLRLLIGQHCNRNDAITADCADARMISELRKYYNISPINKAKWTVPEALKMMQDYEHIITESSYNLSKELSNYIWSDKKAGIPIDAFNHLIDAGRYRFMESIKGVSHQQWHG
ncbi:MAG TPA: phage terminase large subunit [Bacteroidales bacterium]|nr:phage terminase large subunit [Bacteroidales bacterium]